MVAELPNAPGVWIREGRRIEVFYSEQRGMWWYRDSDGCCWLVSGNGVEHERQDLPPGGWTPSTPTPDALAAADALPTIDGRTPHLIDFGGYIRITSKPFGEGGEFLRDDGEWQITLDQQGERCKWPDEAAAEAFLRSLSPPVRSRSDQRRIAVMQGEELPTFESEAPAAQRPAPEAGTIPCPACNGKGTLRSLVEGPEGEILPQ